MNMDNQRRSLSHQFATVDDLSRRVRRNRATLLSSLVQEEDADYEHNNRLNNRNIDDDDDDDRHLPLSVMLRKFNLENGYCDDEQMQAIIGPSSEDNDSNGDNDALRPNNTQSDGVEENAGGGNDAVTPTTKEATFGICLNVFQKWMENISLR